MICKCLTTKALCNSFESLLWTPKTSMVMRTQNLYAAMLPKSSVVLCVPGLNPKTENRVLYSVAMNLGWSPRELGLHPEKSRQSLLKMNLTRFLSVTLGWSRTCTVGRSVDNGSGVCSQSEQSLKTRGSFKLEFRLKVNMFHQLFNTR